MDKRYQVFVSSTYEDLQQERQEVMHALLEMDCIPAGMELFPAANEEQWSLIKRVIDDCDYYLVISAGRYGSIGPTNLSYTEMEYRYALESGKPVIAFLHKDLSAIASGRSEQKDEGKEKLNRFRELMQKKMVKYWTSPSELGSVVSRSLLQLIKTSPAIGWIKANRAEGLAASELLRLREQVVELERALGEARLSAPTGSESLAQSDELFVVHFSFNAYEGYKSTVWSGAVPITWDAILYDIGPEMLAEANDVKIRKSVNTMVKARSTDTLAKESELKNRRLDDFRVTDEDYHTIKIQLRALGLMTKGTKTRTASDTGSYWVLTPLGEQLVTRLRAIPKGDTTAKLSAFSKARRRRQG